MARCRSSAPVPKTTRDAAAHAFCVKHNLTVSVENMACGEMLAEELVEKGARYPLPSEKLLRVRGGSRAARTVAGPRSSSRRRTAPAKFSALVDGAVATPRIAVDIPTEMGRVPFVHFDHSLERDGVPAESVGWRGRAARESRVGLLQRLVLPATSVHST